MEDTVAAVSAAICTERTFWAALMARTGQMKTITRTEALLKETPSAYTAHLGFALQ